TAATGATNAITGSGCGPRMGRWRADGTSEVESSVGIRPSMLDIAGRIGAWRPTVTSSAHEGSRCVKTALGAGTGMEMRWIAGAWAAATGFRGWSAEAKRTGIAQGAGSVAATDCTKLNTGSAFGDCAGRWYTGGAACGSGVIGSSAGGTMQSVKA